MARLISISAPFLLSLYVSLFSLSCNTHNTSPTANTFSPQLGDFALYKLVGGLTQKRSIINIDDNNIQVQVQTFLEQQQLRSETLNIPTQQFYLASSITNINNSLNYQKQTVTLEHKTFNCFIVQSTEQNFSIKKWLSPQAPLDGLVQMARDDNIILQLIPLGNKEL